MIRSLSFILTGLASFCLKYSDYLIDPSSYRQLGVRENGESVVALFYHRQSHHHLMLRILWTLHWTRQFQLRQY